MRRSTIQRMLILAIFPAGAIGFVDRGLEGAVVTTFGESAAPTSNIITSYVPPGLVDAVSWVNDGPANSGHRKVSESFVVPAGPDYTLDKITMKLNGTLNQDFTSPGAFTIDFHQLTNVGDSPTTGTFLQTQSGTMQPTTATAVAGTYFTFDLDNTITLEAGEAYAYVLDFPSAADYHFIKLEIGQSGGAVDGSTVWRDINGGGWNPIGDTYVYYIQGEAVPEPATIGWSLAGLGLGLGRASRRRGAGPEVA